MSPHHLFWHRHHRFYNPMFYGPSRFLWFSIGSLATIAWMHHHRRDAAQIGYEDSRGCVRGRGQWGEREAGPHAARFDSDERQQRRRGTVVPPDDDYRFDANGGGRPVVAVAEATNGGRFPTDQELDRLRELSRNAEERISGMSEATIDSLMGSLQRLKDRLAERRGLQLQDSQQPSATTTPLATPPAEPRHWV